MTQSKRLVPCDWVVLSYSALVIVLVLATHARVPYWGAFVAGHAAVMASVLILARLGWRWPRDLDLAVYIPALFMMTCFLVHRVHPVDYDAQLIRIDRSIGGLALLKWMETIQTAFLTDFSKLLWIAYYPLPVIPGLIVILRKSREEIQEMKVLFALTWLVSYVGYFALPAQGPGYMQQEIGVAQPKWEESKVSPALKDTIYKLEGDARDTFPSGHVMIAAMSIVACVRFRLRRAVWIVTPLALGVIWSTLYLRYHYLIDGMVGILLVAGIAWAGKWWLRPGRGEGH